MDPRSKLESLAAISKAFRPYAPIDDLRLFAGREPQVRALLSTVFEEGRHAALYGDRGVGKTSLANVVSELLQQDGADTPVLVIRVTCATGDTFEKVWRRVFGQITITRDQRRLGFVAQSEEERFTFDEMFPEPLGLPECGMRSRGLGDASSSSTSSTGLGAARFSERLRIASRRCRTRPLTRRLSSSVLDEASRTSSASMSQSSDVSTKSLCRGWHARR